VVVVVFANM